MAIYWWSGVTGFPQPTFGLRVRPEDRLPVIYAVSRLHAPGMLGLSGSDFVGKTTQPARLIHGQDCVI